MGMFDAASIGQRITFARQRAGGMTQRDLAEAIGVSTRSLQNYENGTRVPWKLLRSIAEVTGVDFEWLLHGDDDSAETAMSPEDELRAQMKALLEEMHEIRALLEQREDQGD